jgi:hypothetical protein
MFKVNKILVASCMKDLSLQEKSLNMHLYVPRAMF